MVRISMRSLPSADFVACPWCKTEEVKLLIRQKTLRLKCGKCGMDAYVTKIPRNKKVPH